MTCEMCVVAKRAELLLYLLVSDSARAEMKVDSSCQYSERCRHKTFWGRNRVRRHAGFVWGAHEMCVVAKRAELLLYLLVSDSARAEMKVDSSCQYSERCRHKTFWGRNRVRRHAGFGPKKSC